MIQLIVLSKQYVLEGEYAPPMCAFLDTITMKFLTCSDGTNVFTSKEDVNEQNQKDRLHRLIPPGFWSNK